MRYVATFMLLLSVACGRAEAQERIERFVFPEMVIRASPPAKRKPARVEKKVRRAPREFQRRFAARG
jgi:hypothetical protein